MTFQKKRCLPPSTDRTLVLKHNDSSLGSNAGIGVKKVKLGIEETGDENSGGSCDLQQLPELTAPAVKEGVRWFIGLEKNDEWHEKTGESSCSLFTISGDPSRKLRS